MGRAGTGPEVERGTWGNWGAAVHRHRLGRLNAINDSYIKKNTTTERQATNNLFTSMFMLLLMAQYLDVDSSEDDNDMHLHTPPY